MKNNRTIKLSILAILILALLISFLILPLSLNFASLKNCNFLALGVSIVMAYFIALFVAISFNDKSQSKISTIGRTRKWVSMLMLFTISLSTSAYCIYVVLRGNNLVEFLRSENVRGWKGKAHSPDPELGFAPIKNARAYHTFKIGEDIPMAYNEHGFRIPVNDTMDMSNYDDLGILFLGCSFTYGDATLAEETFPYLIGKKTGISYINAGVCSYGLSQMLILSEGLIPKYRPEYVVIQFSPWLISRSTKIYLPVYFGTLPTPYFSLTNDSLHIESPVYRTHIFDDFVYQIKSQNNISNYINSFKFYLKQDFLCLNTKFKLLSGKIEPPTTNIFQAEYLAYEKMIQNARENGSKVILVGLYNVNENNIKELVDGENVIFIDANEGLEKYLKENNLTNFSKTFAHWRLDGQDSVLVDNHPNSLAHDLISKSILKVIEKSME